MRMRIFKKVYKYKSGNIIIRSEVPLEEEKVTSIIDTINKYIEEGCYDPCYYISRTVYYIIEDLQIHRVEANLNSRRVVLDFLK